mgnify:CR=1 FL=1
MKKNREVVRKRSTRRQVLGVQAPSGLSNAHAEKEKVEKIELQSRD